MNKLNFIPYEFPRSSDGQLLFMQEDHQVLLSRREQLGLTQQQVADMAHIQLRQYQRIESGDRHLSGCSMRIGLGVCAVLLLNPYDFLEFTVQQPDVKSLKPLPAVDGDFSWLSQASKRVGRKPIRRERKVYLNHDKYCVIIPDTVLVALGKPSYIQLLYNPENNRIRLRPAVETDNGALDIPYWTYEGHPYAIYAPTFTENLRKKMSWGNETHIADARIVKTNSGDVFVDIDPSRSSITEPVMGSFAISERMDDENGF